MSKNKHRHASTEAASSAPTTELTPQPTQEKTMEATQQNTEPTAETIPPSAAEPIGPTAKEMAAAEEVNQARLLRQAQMQQEEVVISAVPLADVAARGYDALQEQFKRHNEAVAKKKEYVPPPRTPNQMNRLQEELEAGARAVERAKAQQAARPPQEPPVGNKEGFTTPVYRPDNVVPDPMNALTNPGKEGLKGVFSPDA